LVEVLDSEDGLRLGPMWVGEEEDFPDAGDLEDIGDTECMEDMAHMTHMLTFVTHPILIHTGLIHIYMVHLPMDGETPTGFQELLMPTELVTLRTVRCRRGTPILLDHGIALTNPRSRLLEKRRSG
jgi:hypothetical protein